MTAIRHLTRAMPSIARLAPGTVVQIGLAPWEFEEARRSPTPLISSAILGMSSNFQQDVEGERYTVGTGFATLMRADPLAGATLLLRILNRQSMYPLPPLPEMREPPHVRQGSPLAIAGGHQILPAMIDEFARELQHLAETGDGSAPDGDQQDHRAEQIVTRLLDELQHGEAWKRLLFQAATASTAALARVLLPALSTPSLYAYHETWIEAAHAVRRAADLLGLEELARVRAAIDGITDAGTSPTRPEYRDAFEQRRGVVLAAVDDPGSGDRPAKTDSAALGPHSLALPQVSDISDLPVEMRWETDTPAPGSIDDLARRVDEQLQQPAHVDESGDATACAILISLRDELDNLATTQEDRESDALDLAAQIAGRLADCPDTAPDGPLGGRVIAALLTAVPDVSEAPGEQASRQTPRPSWESSLTAGWQVTAATTGAQVLVRLYRREPWRSAHGDQIHQKLSPLLDGPDPVLRLIAADAMPTLFGTHESLIAELGPRLASETDRHVATRLMRMLGDLLHHYPHDVDGVLERLAAMPHWAVLSASPAGDQEISPGDQGSTGVQILANLAAVHDTPYARKVLAAWLTAPVDHPGRATGALHCLGDLLNPADPRFSEAQERLFSLIQTGVTQANTVIGSAATTPAPNSEQLHASVGSAFEFADHLARQIYSASGAFDENHPTQAPKPRGDLQRFAGLVLPVLEALSTIHAPRLTLNIVQTADHIAPAAPKRVLKVAVNAVTGDPAYWREHLGVEAVLHLIRHFAADYRDVLLGDSEATAAVRQLLESFIRLGWAQAIRLAEDLDELFT